MEGKDTILRLTPMPPEWSVFWDALRRSGWNGVLSD